MSHPHFALGALGAEQGDLFAVDWKAVEALGATSYNAALLSIAQGAQLGMPQGTIDTAINVVLVRNKAPNMFRVLFGLYPLSVTGYIAERDRMVRDMPEDWQWFQKTNDGYTLKRELLNANKGAKEVTAAELKQIAEVAGWTKKQIADATSGKNVYQLRPDRTVYYVAGAAVVGLLIYWATR